MGRSVNPSPCLSRALRALPEYNAASNWGTTISSGSRAAEYAALLSLIVDIGNGAGWWAAAYPGPAPAQQGYRQQEHETEQVGSGGSRRARAAAARGLGGPTTSALAGRPRSAGGGRAPRARHRRSARPTSGRRRGTTGRPNAGTASPSTGAASPSTGAARPSTGAARPNSRAPGPAKPSRTAGRGRPSVATTRRPTAHSACGASRRAARATGPAGRRQCVEQGRLVRNHHRDPGGHPGHVRSMPQVAHGRLPGDTKLRKGHGHHCVLRGVIEEGHCLATLGKITRPYFRRPLLHDSLGLDASEILVDGEHLLVREQGGRPGVVRQCRGLPAEDERRRQDAPQRQDRHLLVVTERSLTGAQLPEREHVRVGPVSLLEAAHRLPLASEVEDVVLT